MLNINFIRENKEFVIERLKVKRFNKPDIIEQIILTDEKKRAAQKQSDDALAEMNTLSKQIGQLFQEGKRQEADILKQKTVELKENIRDFNTLLAKHSAELDELIIQVPNLPHISVPLGIGAEDNPVVRGNDLKISLPSGSLPHWELAKKYDIIDFELGNKLTGAGFPVYKGKGARLQRALSTSSSMKTQMPVTLKFFPPLW
jgi:seryl-tRNA synthetase